VKEFSEISFDCKILYKITFLWFSKKQILVKKFFSIRFDCQILNKIRFCGSRRKILVKEFS